MKKFFPFLFFISFVFILASCAPRVSKPVSVMDNPEHHARNGNKFIESGEIDKAMESFNRAIQLDPKYGPAYVGLGMVYTAKKDYGKALENLKKGRSYDAGIEANIGYIRFYSAQREKGWLKDAEDEYKDGLKIAPENERLYYFMGKAYKFAYEFDKASITFKKVLTLNKEYTKEANEEWELVQKIQRAAPGTNIGNQIAFIEKIGRADVAALFIEELKLDKLYDKKGKVYNTSFATPDEKKFETEKTIKLAEATDIPQHPLKADIEIAIKIGVRGLEPFPDHTFQPQKLITKAEYAIMIEDIIIKITGDKELAGKFFGNESPFPDIRNDHYAFNAIMVTTSRGILQAKLNGEFGLMDSVSGADALLAIRKLKDELKL